jgi:glycerophosphoryl diester phosphodiesterase
MDVRRCGDGTIVVIHDHTIDRTTNGRGRVRDFSWTQLQQFDAGHGEQIPRLADVLETFGRRCLLNIEIKESGLLAAIRQLIVELHVEDNILISSFDHDDNEKHASSYWEELADPSSVTPVALICSRTKLSRIGPAALVTEAARLGAIAVHPQIGSDWSRLLPVVREAGLQVHVWTVNDARDIAQFRDLGVDGIFTDFPERGALK